MKAPSGAAQGKFSIKTHSLCNIDIFFPFVSSQEQLVQAKVFQNIFLFYGKNISRTFLTIPSDTMVFNDSPWSFSNKDLKLEILQSLNYNSNKLFMAGYMKVTVGLQVQPRKLLTS